MSQREREKKGREGEKLLFNIVHQQTHMQCSVVSFTTSFIQYALFDTIACLPHA